MREEMTHANAVTPLFATRRKLYPLPVKMISEKMIEKLASCNFHFLFPREQQERQLTFELSLGTAPVPNLSRALTADHRPAP